MKRRDFLTSSAVAAAGLGSVSEASVFSLFGKKKKSLNDKLNIGVIGVNHRGGANLNGVAGENIVALCDVDQSYLAAAGERFPGARTYTDYRRLLDQKDLDAVVISTPDHSHAVIASHAFDEDLHVYCEKPLTHTVSEARYLSAKATRKGLATQMGNQIHAGTNYRRVVEEIQSGSIGKVREVHVWVGKVHLAQPYPEEIIKAPDNVDYDLWLGPVAYRPYNPQYLPKTWRDWWHFGGGTLADFGCHYMDLPHWALSLGHPFLVESEGPAAHPEGPPPWQKVTYRFPERGDLPPVTMIWYQGEKRPPHFDEGILPKWGNGVLFVGDEGLLLADYNKYRLLPEDRFEDHTPPIPFIPDSIGHHAEWIQACKTGGSTTCNFNYGAALTENVLLGNVSHRIGQPIHWDAVNMEASNTPDAEQFIHHQYRKGWKL
ncbi:Gfo/Idh/MocA family oxidoreductase [Verrucomicrobia bacterium]|nr:Gfo/Idh/MocA family oxidoreductase [Verrucomicrobiota bacterium]